VSASNGVIRIGRKGIKKFAFGDGEPFDVDVVVAFQGWIGIDERFRISETDSDLVTPDDVGTISTADMPAYHLAALEFVRRLATNPNGSDTCTAITVAEALDFLARLREQYDELADFFRPKLREKRDSQDTSGVELRFSEEPTANSTTSTN
jgi:hypothetical protein